MTDESSSCGERHSLPEPLYFAVEATDNAVRGGGRRQLVGPWHATEPDAGPRRACGSKERRARRGVGDRPGDRLCVTRLDRLGRSLRELLETVDTLKAHGIHLVSLEERLDTSSAVGELVFYVFRAIAHFERRLISERTRDGIAAARKRGRTPGRPPPILRQFPRLRNSSTVACRPLARRNSSTSAGQRLTESPRRCAPRNTRPYRNPTNKPCGDALRAAHNGLVGVDSRRCRDVRSPNAKPTGITTTSTH